MERFVGILSWLATQEGRRQLRQAVTGVQERWGFYVDAVSWFQPMGRETPLPSKKESSDDGEDDPMDDGDGGDPYAGTYTGRLDRVINYMIDQAEKREYNGPAGEIATMINQIASTEVRELLHELSKPEVRLALCVFQLYGTGGRDDDDGADDDESDDGCDDDSDDGSDDDVDYVAVAQSLRRFLNFSQDDHEGVAFRIHRRVRARRRYLLMLASEDEDDGGEYYECACARLINYVESTDGAFEDIDVRSVVQSTFSAAHDFFDRGVEGNDSSPGTQYLFRNPVYLAPGMLDEGGEGVLGRIGCPVESTPCASFGL
eukprot:6119672-Prymnesium_polylepis.1